MMEIISGVCFIVAMGFISLVLIGAIALSVEKLVYAVRNPGKILPIAGPAITIALSIAIIVWIIIGAIEGFK